MLYDSCSTISNSAIKTVPLSRGDLLVLLVRLSFCRSVYLSVPVPNVLPAKPVIYSRPRLVVKGNKPRTAASSASAKPAVINNTRPCSTYLALW